MPTCRVVDPTHSQSGRRLNIVGSETQPTSRVEDTTYGLLMTFRTYVLKNVLRNKRRTALTVLSIGFSLFLLIVLYTFLDLLMNPPVTEDSAYRLAVRRSTSLSEQMPIAYMDRINRIDHVELVIPLQWFNGIYKDPKFLFANFATSPRVFEMFPEQRTSEETRRRFALEKTGAVVGQGLMERFGWKVGDRVTLTGTIFPVDLEFLIVGSYDHELDRNNFYFRYDYFNEVMDEPNEVGAFWIRADSIDHIDEIARKVDMTFRNTPAETKTETEKAFILGFISMLGNVRVMVGSIMSVVVFTMLLVSASTMAMTIRERLREIAILKAVGYTRDKILGLILGESILIGVLGFVFGAGLSWSMNFVDLNRITQGFIQAFLPTWKIYSGALFIGMGIGLLSGLFPAIQASGMTIRDAIRRLE